jgi:hypothetical protein
MVNPDKKVVNPNKNKMKEKFVYPNKNSFLFGYFVVNFSNLVNPHKKIVNPSRKSKKKDNLGNPNKDF